MRISNQRDEQDVDRFLKDLRVPAGGAALVDLFPSEINGEYAKERFAGGYFRMDPKDRDVEREWIEKLQDRAAEANKNDSNDVSAKCMLPPLGLEIGQDIGAVFSYLRFTTASDY